MGILNFAQKAIIEKDGKVLVIKFSMLSKNMAGLYDLPGGRMNFGEDVDEHIKREVREETNLEIEPLEPIHIAQWFVYKGKADIKESHENDLQIVAVFRRCKYISGDTSLENIEKDELIENIEWLDPNELINLPNTSINVKTALERYLLIT